MGLVAPWHVGSSQTRARTRVPCIGRQILNHCATREALESFLVFCILLGICSFLLGYLFFWHTGAYSSFYSISFLFFRGLVVIFPPDFNNLSLLSFLVSLVKGLSYVEVAKK